MREVILGDVAKNDCQILVQKHMPPGGYPLMIADPPYGNIVDESWDQTMMSG